MADLTAARRKRLPDSDFALPGRRYPIYDEAHAKAALAMVAAHGTETEQDIVQRKVKKRYPNMQVTDQQPTARYSTRDRDGDYDGD